MIFAYDPAVFERFPAIVGGIILAEGVSNGPGQDELRARFESEQRTVRERIGTTPLSEIPALAAWRKVFRAFGVDPTQYRPAAEALLRRLTKSGDLPFISTLVDAGNLVSIRYGIPTAVFDLANVGLPVTVRIANGSERFDDIGQSQSEHPAPGEVIFSDALGVVVARRWCWRQGREGAVSSDTTRAVITMEAHHPEARADIERMLMDLQALLAAYAGGAMRHAVLDADHPVFS